MSYGQLSRIGLSFQNSFGAPLASSVYWLPVVSESIALAKPQIIAQGMRGIHDEGAHYEGANAAAGDLEIEAEAVPLGVMLKAWAGDPVTVTSGSLYTHTFKPRTSDFDEVSAGNPCTVHKYMGVGSADQFSDMNASTLEISVANGELLGAKISMVGGSFAQTVGLAASYDNGKHFSWDASSVTIAGAAVSELKDLTLTVDESIEASHTLNGSKYPSRCKRSGFRSVNIAGTIMFDNDTEYNAFLNQTERNLTAHFEGQTAVQSGYNEALTVIVPLGRTTEFSPQVGGAGEIEVSFSSKGVYSVTSATATAFELRNGQAAY